MENTDIFILASNCPSLVQVTSSDPSTVNCIFNIGSLFKVFVILFRSTHICATQQPIWDLGEGLCLSAILKVCGMLFRVKYMDVQVGETPRTS